MSSRQYLEGYYIQSPEISSSTDVARSPNFIFPITTQFPTGRRSYRSTIYLQSTIPRLRIENDEPPRNLVPCIISSSFVISGQSNIRTRTALISVGVIFLTSLFTLFLVYNSFPKLQPDERQHIKIPWNINEAKHLGIILDRYKQDHFYSVLAGVFFTYIFLQTFAIPGSLFLSILSGFLFNFYIALTLVCTCSALGATLCFFLSQLLGKRLIWIYFPKKAKEWAAMVEKHQDNLFNYMVFLRVTPFLPNWFINLTAPVIGVPLIPFALGTFVGVAPPSFVAIQAGQTLHRMSASDSAFSWTSIFWLGVFAVFSLIPIFFKRQLKEKFQ
nr:transmembrane protein 41B isoform X1 [Onthophagus taurus]